MARRGDGLFERGGGKVTTWWLEAVINGTRYQRRLGRGIPRSVTFELAQVQRAAVLKGEAGIGKKRKDIQFEIAKEKFLDWAIVNKRPRTVRVYTQQLEQLAKSFNGKPLSKISSFDIERHKRDRVQEGARVVANREVAVLKNLYNKAKAWNLYEGENPVTSVTMLKEPKGRDRYLEHAEEAALLEASTDSLRSIIIVGCNTGIRINAEGFTLKWSDVDLSRNLLTVQAAYSKNGQTRSIPLNSRARAALEQLKRTSRGEYVFAKADGSRYQDGSMDPPLRKACRSARLSGVSLHVLRHTFASRLVMAGVNLVTVMKLGGWSDLKTVQRYAHLSPSHKTKAIQSIAEGFDKATQECQPSGATLSLAEKRARV